MRSTLDVVECFVDHLADAQALTALTIQSCLHRAVVNHKYAVSIVRYLMSKFRTIGVDVDATDKKGLTALHKACSLGKRAVMQELILQGANVNCRDAGQNTPLHHAFRKSKYKCASSLIHEHNADVNNQDVAGNTSLLSFIKNPRKCVWMARTLIAHPDFEIKVKSRTPARSLVAKRLLLLSDCERNRRQLRNGGIFLSAAGTNKQTGKCAENECACKHRDTCICKAMMLRVGTR